MRPNLAMYIVYLILYYILSPLSNTLSNPKIIGVILLFYKSEGREGMILNAIVWLINHLQMTTHLEKPSFVL